MSQCIDKDVGQLLHDYELGLLSADDNRRFEMHLYECDHCLNQVREFRDTSRILIGDPDFQKLTSDLAGDDRAPDSSKRTFPFVKYLMVAVIVLAIAVPLYRLAFFEDMPPVTQTLELNPARAGANNIVYLDDGGDVEIRFFIADNFAASINLTISTVEGDTLLAQSDFNEYAAPGVGKICLPLAKFSEGHYVLTVSPEPPGAVSHRTYMFRVE